MDEIKLKRLAMGYISKTMLYFPNMPYLFILGFG